MKCLIAVLALSCALGASAEEKQKKPSGAPAGAVSVDELVKQAEQKAAAGDAAGAVELLRKATALPTATGDTFLRLGRQAEAAFDLEAAIDAYKAGADKLSGPAKGEALGRLALLQEMRGAPEAAATAEAAIAADPAGAYPLAAASRAKSRAGLGEEGVALALKAKAAGGGGAADAAHGYAQEARGDMAAAEAAYRAAAATDAGKISGNVGLARVMRKTGRAAEAEPILKQVIDQAPGAIEAYKESARVKIALGRSDEAVGDAATAAALAEHDPEAQQLALEVSVARSLGDVAKGQPDLAIQDLTALRDKNPQSGLVRVGLAKAYIAKRQTDLALTELTEAVKLEPGLAEAQYQLGYVQFVGKGNAAAAVPAYEKAVTAEPGNVTYRTGLGAALTGVGQFDRAVAELKKVTETPGYEKADAWIYLGQAHLQAKRYKDAIPALEKATAIAPNAPEPWAYLGWSYFGLKDADNFKKAAGKARTLGYKEPTLLQYLQRIEGGEAIK